MSESHQTQPITVEVTETKPKRPPRNPSRGRLDPICDDDEWKDIKALWLDAAVYTDEPESSLPEELAPAKPERPKMPSRPPSIRRKPVPYLDESERKCLMKASCESASMEKSKSPLPKETTPERLVSSRQSTIRRKPVPHSDKSEPRHEFSSKTPRAPALCSDVTAAHSCFFTCPHSQSSQALVPLPHQGRTLALPAPPALHGPASHERAGPTELYVAVRSAADDAPAPPTHRPWTLAWFLQDGPDAFAARGAAMRVLGLQDNVAQYTFHGPVSKIFGADGYTLVRVGRLTLAQRRDLEVLAEAAEVRHLACGGMPAPEVWSSQQWVADLLRAAAATGLLDNSDVGAALAKAKQASGFDVGPLRRKTGEKMPRRRR